MGAPPPLRLQERDLRLLTDLGQVLLLDSRTIHLRYYATDASGKSMLRRLRLLREHRIVEPIRLSVAFAERAKLLLLYRLTPTGVELLEDLTGTPPVRMPPPDLPKPITLHHRAAVARIVLTINDACSLQKLPPPEWLLEGDTVPNASPTDHPSKRFVLYESFQLDRYTAVTCRPDASSRLRVPAPPAEGEAAWNDLLIYWELDRSTETHAQVGKKMPGFKALLDQHAYRRHWPQLTPHEAVRIFFVCQSAERLENLRTTLRDLPAADFLRFTTVAEIEPTRLLTEPIWQTVKGDRRSIIRTPKDGS